MNTEKPPAIGLNRSIRKWEVVLLMINSIIGAGIFGLPSKVFALSGVYSLLAFFACAIVIMIIIFCFAEVSSRFDKTGGPYLYTLNAFGPFPAYLMGWLLLLSRIFNFASLVNLIVIYLSFFSGSFNDPLIRGICILFVTVALTLINHIGVKNTTRVNNILTIAKLLPLTLFVVIGLFNLQTPLFSPGPAPSLDAFSTSVLLLVFAFGGFEAVLVNSGEIQNPKKNLPFALITASAFIAFFYFLIQLVCIGTLPGLASSEKPVAEAASGFMGRSGGGLIVIGAVISILGALNAIVLSGSRLPFALSKEGQLPPVFSTIHPRYLTPTVSLVVFSLIIAAFSLVWSFIAALAIGAIVRTCVYLIVCASMIKLRKKKPGGDHFTLRYGYAAGIAGVILTAWLLTFSKLTELRDVLICMLAGVACYGLYNWWKRKSETKKL
ncbi:MAG TPA: APC family permease [Chitinophagaceae bacterium]